MDRNTVVRWVVIAAAMILFWKYGMPLISGKSDRPQALPEETYVNAPSFVPDVVDPATPDHPQGVKPPEGEICKIKGNRFDAELSSRGAALTHFHLRDPRYRGTDGFDMSTTPDVERWRSLRTLFRSPDAVNTASQFKFDRFNWTLAPQTADTTCTFEYSDDQVAVKKTVSADGRPFELSVKTEITNKSDSPKNHRFAIEQFAFRRNSEVKGNLGRVSPFQTDMACAREKDVTRKGKDDFKDGNWFSEPLTDRFAAISNYYFTQAIVPDGEKPECSIVAEDWFSAGQTRTDDSAAAVYHARLTSAPRTLGPNETATYKQTAFFGPKERDVLAVAAGGHAGLGDVINLGFFSPVAKVLVSVLVFFHDHVTMNWGLAIIAMTICLRLLLFPLSIKQIRTTIAMRKLKPEIDAVNKKFADDAQAKQMATMELWRKHGVNPLGGCLPQLVQMPVWFAMYTTLQTAVEMYHTKFLWFSDLSAPDRFYILPLVLGAFMIIQQRVVPQQGMDPMQQKMMMYLLPGVFTVMMLFLPAALGVYMLTNSVLGIGQQLLIERIAPRDGASPQKKGEIVVKQGPAESFGKGKARV